MDSQTMIVGLMKSTILYSLQILQERIFQYVIKWEAVAFHIEVSRQNVKLNTSRQI
jgi:hypothetical protein